MSSAEQLRRVESHAYPSQHIGFLEPQHEKALQDFKELCSSKGYFTPAEGNKPASHDDETMLRYLRARKWVPQDAWTQFKDTEDWRKENQIDKLYERIDVAEYDVGRRLYPQWTGRRDKRGIPVYVFEVAHLTTKAVAAYEKASNKPGEVESKLPPKMLRLFALYENLCNFALPLCSMMPDRQYPQTPVSQSSNIVDISNVSLKQFWNLKNHMQDASQLATAHYPETLDRIFILGAPGFFPTVWGWIKRWFDPITVSKIFILSKAQTLPTLEQFMDRDDIPKKYGGNLDFTFGDLPNIEPAIEKNLQWIHGADENGKKTFPIGPIQWRENEKGEMVAIAVGTENGKQRSTEVAKIVKLPSTSDQLSNPTNLTTGPTALTRLPSAVDTQPPTPPADEVDLSNPPSGSSTPAFSARGTPAQNPDAASFGGSPIPYRNGPSDNNRSNVTSESPTAAEPTTAPADTSDTVREGTTSTRYEQQSSTLGAGQLKEDTPETRVNRHGDKYGVMEPGTVAQAPKEHPVPSPVREEPGMFDQVKGMAGSAVGVASAAASSVAGMVGLGGGAKTEEADKKTEEEETRDPAVDKATPEQVEEFLRAKTSSDAA